MSGSARLLGLETELVDRLRRPAAQPAQRSAVDQNILLHWQAGPETYLDQLCRAAEFDHAYVDETICPFEQRLLKEG
jgi:hypothetical protein